jgi:hypothetical protein
MADKGDEVAVHIAGIKLPLYGVVESEDRREKRVTVRVFSKYGERVMTVDSETVHPWRKS